jgi:hypothetical protein
LVRRNIPVAAPLGQAFFFVRLADVAPPNAHQTNFARFEAMALRGRSSRDRREYLYLGKLAAAGASSIAYWPQVPANANVKRRGLIGPAASVVTGGRSGFGVARTSHEENDKENRHQDDEGDHAE